MAKILIVEDEAGLREFLSMVVEELGHEVRTAANGVEALRLIEQSRADLVISDVMMPEMDGYILLKNIRLKQRQWPNLKLILVSAAFNNSKRGEARLKQADEYLAKPFELRELEAVISRTLSPDE